MLCSKRLPHTSIYSGRLKLVGKKCPILFSLYFTKIIVSIENVIHKLLKIMPATFVT